MCRQAIFRPSDNALLVLCPGTTTLVYLVGNDKQVKPLIKSSQVPGFGVNDMAIDTMDESIFMAGGQGQAKVVKFSRNGTVLWSATQGTNGGV